VPDCTLYKCIFIYFMTPVFQSVLMFVLFSDYPHILLTRIYWMQLHLFRLQSYRFRLFISSNLSRAIRSVPACLSIYPTIHPSNHVSIHSPTKPCTHPSISQATYSSNHIPNHLPTSLSTPPRPTPTFQPAYPKTLTMKTQSVCQLIQNVIMHKHMITPIMHSYNCSGKEFIDTCN
jgi:hypothetical protein